MGHTNDATLTTREAAARLGVTPRTVRRYVLAGRLAGRQLGTYPNAPLMISAESVEQLRAERQRQDTERSIS